MSERYKPSDWDKKKPSLFPDSDAHMVLDRHGRIIIEDNKRDTKLINCNTTPDCRCAFYTKHDLFIHNRSGKHGPMYQWGG